MYRKYSNIIMIIVLAILYFIFGKFTLYISNTHTIVTIIIFIPEGIALASALLFGKKILPGIFIGQFLLAITENLPFYPSLIISFINTFEALIAIKLFKKFKLNISLDTKKDIFGLIFLIIFILQPFSSILGNLTLFSFSIIDKKEILYNLFSWWFGNFMGQLLITTLILYTFTKYKDIYKIEFFLVGLFSFFITYLFLIFFKIPYISLLTSFSMPFLIYLTYKRNLAYSLFCVALISFVAVLSTYLNVGAFSSDDNIKNIISLNFFILSHLILILIIGVLFEENKQELIININKSKQLLQAEKQASMMELIINIAHHWRQPLSVISTSATGMIMQKQLGNLDNQKFIKICNRINTTAQSLSKTIDNFTKEIQNTSMIQKNKFKLSHSIEIFINSQKELFDKYNIKIILDLDDIELNTHEQKLILCLLNMINNSIDAFEKNNITKRYIFISSKIDSDIINLEIKDNANGIDEKIISKIYEPYFTTKYKEQDVGLGLSTVYNFIVNKLNGQIEVKNIEFEYYGIKYKGALFTIKLPI